MNFFLDPAIFTLPNIDTVQPAEFERFIDQILEWSRLLNSDHSFYLSTKCNDILFDSDTYDYPPTCETLKHYWERFGDMLVYSVQDVYTACSRLFDITGLKTIEELANAQKDPEFTPTKTYVEPGIVCTRHSQAMREALGYALGCMAFFYNDQKQDIRDIFQQMLFASHQLFCESGCLQDGLSIHVKAEVFLLQEGEQTAAYEADFRLKTDPEAIRKAESEVCSGTSDDEMKQHLDRIPDRKKFLVLGGHPRQVRKLLDLIPAEKRIEIIHRFERSRMRETKQLVKQGKVDAVICLTGYTSHTVMDIKSNLSENTPWIDVDNKGIEALVRALVEAFERMKPNTSVV